MREIIFDTETTGLDARVDRIIEIGAVELVNRFPTGRTFHVYINPDGRQINPEAEAVHGISLAQLADKPVFAGVAAELMEFIEGGTLIAHNASFDMAFVNAELGRLGHAAIEDGRVVDSLAIARRKHPMGPNSLDALCKRYSVDNRHRTRHGALLDSGLLAEVYIELMGGRQATFGLEVTIDATDVEIDVEILAVSARTQPLPPRLTEAERAAHAAMVAKLGEKALWLRPEFEGVAAA